MSDKIQWTSSGRFVYASKASGIPDFDHRTKDHLWTWMAVYRGEPNTETPIVLGSENLLLALGPGCFYCEAQYTPHIQMRRCPGLRSS